MAAKVVTLHWYSGKHGLVHREAPTLAICYDNGRMQIMRDENDESKASIFPFSKLNLLRAKLIAQ